MTILNMILPNIEWWWGGWQPGANTVAYYPLNWDTLDHSGNGYDMSTRIGTITYGTLTSWTQYWIFNWNTILSTTNKATVSTGTISAYVYYNGEGLIFMDNVNTNGSNDYVSVFLKAWWEYYCIYSPAIDIPKTTSPSSWWNLLTLTQDWNNLIFYINGVKTQELSTSTFLHSKNWNQRCIWWLARWTQYYDKLNWYVSNIIIENKVRTAQEILDYYNQTKANYWIQSLSNTLTITPNITPTITPNTPNNWSWSVLSI